MNGDSWDWSEDGSLRYAVPIEEGVSLHFVAKDVRRERTGLHALVAILLNERVLAHDTFNVGRNEERYRLAKSAHSLLSPAMRDSYPLASLKHELDLFCLKVERAWEQRYQVEEFDGTGSVGPVAFTLSPYLLDEGGTIIFAPPGQGKSYVSLLMAQSINSGCQRLWPVRQKPVLYINLERPAVSMRRRMVGVNQALGVHPSRTLTFLNARGQSLKDVASSARSWVRSTRGVVFLDSISRSGLGSLVEDETANSVIDTLNWIAPTWLAIAHTPRATEDHAYGSIHFDAGVDIGVKLSSDRSESTLVICLRVVKANDIAVPKPQLLRLQFGAEGLQHVGVADPTEFPELLGQQGSGRLERLVEYLREHGPTTATEAAQATGIARPHVVDIFRHSGRFVKLKSIGRHHIYALKEHVYQGTHGGTLA